MADKNLTNYSKVYTNTSVYDFALVGGTHTDVFKGFILPTGAKPFRAIIKGITTLTSGGATTLWIYLDSAGGTDVDIVATATAYTNAMFKAGATTIVDLSTAAATTDANLLIIDVETASLTAGVFSVTVEYYL